MFAFITGIQTILNGGHDIILKDALIYAVLSTISCFSIYVIESHIASSVDSELVRIDSQEWLIDGILSAAILVGFVSVIICNGLGYSKWSTYYIDPILVTALALFASILPRLKFYVVI
ncbi:cation transporter [Photobacterium kishitanii]|uniref:cation transporter n=1 Tax=Photobacterium kishitanii TaxID=318456 RepID=UPI002738B071|nr:cation transporter [Photobacterium kishitanii]